MYNDSQRRGFWHHTISKWVLIKSINYLIQKNVRPLQAKEAEDKVSPVNFSKS